MLQNEQVLPYRRGGVPVSQVQVGQVWTYLGVGLGPDTVQSLYSKVPSPGGRAVRFLYGEVQCIMGDGHMGPLPPPPREQTDVTENITFRNFVGGR